MKLQPCPFCGELATREKDECWIIGCLTETCPGWIGSSNAYDTEADAIAAWSTRADGWISVDERLPEDIVDVLVTDGWTFTVAHYNQKRNQFLLTADMIEADGNTAGPYLDGIVTHWRPLPPPPITQQ